MLLPTPKESIGPAGSHGGSNVGRDDRSSPDGEKADGHEQPAAQGDHAHAPHGDSASGRESKVRELDRRTHTMCYGADDELATRAEGQIESIDRCNQATWRETDAFWPISPDRAER